MKRVLICVGAVFMFCVLAFTGAYAENAVIDYKEGLAKDKAAIRADRDAIKQKALESRQKEKQLRDQIRAAEKSGDTAAVKQLITQLRTMHQANVQEMRQNRQTLRSSVKELRQDRKEARKHGIKPPKKDNDNNPPGPRGGPGTNWENLPGPRGGPGASPDRKD